MANPLRRALAKSIRAFHGSPHDFDRFDMGKIGTGEGAQAYGHGLYFAEAEDVARSYRDQLARSGGGGSGPRMVTSYQVGKTHISQANPEWAAADVAHTMQQYGIDPKTRDGADWLASELSARYMGGSNITKNAVMSYLQKGVRQERAPGRMYEVNIDADPADFLDWDAPLSAQSERVREAVARARGDVGPDAFAGASTPLGMRSGQSTYTDVGLIKGKNLPPNAAQSSATQALLDAGIPGIRYLDGQSRGAGEGSRNYVLFRDDIVNILRKYAMPFAVGAGAASGGGGALRQALAQRLSSQEEA